MARTILTAAGAAEEAESQQEHLRRSGRPRAERNFYHKEVLLPDGTIEFHRTENHGLNQPGMAQPSQEQQEKNELERFGLHLYSKHCRRRGWHCKKPQGLSNDYVFRAPGVVAPAQYEEGKTQFTSFVAIAKKCEELGGEEAFAEFVRASSPSPQQPATGSTLRDATSHSPSPPSELTNDRKRKAAESTDVAPAVGSRGRCGTKCKYTSWEDLMDSATRNPVARPTETNQPDKNSAKPTLEDISNGTETTTPEEEEEEEAKGDGENETINTDHAINENTPSTLGDSVNMHVEEDEIIAPTVTSAAASATNTSDTNAVESMTAETTAVNTTNINVGAGANSSEPSTESTANLAAVKQEDTEDHERHDDHNTVPSTVEATRDQHRVNPAAVASVRPQGNMKARVDALAQFFHGASQVHPSYPSRIAAIEQVVGMIPASNLVMQRVEALERFRQRIEALVHIVLEHPPPGTNTATATLNLLDENCFGVIFLDTTMTTRVENLEQQFFA